MMEPGKKVDVFTVREHSSGDVWLKIGVGIVNKDGSLNLLLDALPITGKLHVKEQK